MANKAQAEKTELELSCREAHLILRVIPLRKNVNAMKEEEVVAIKHYLYCKDCRDRGLADILDTKLSCQEAVVVWAERANALWLDCSLVLGPHIEALIELYAAEHVWGKYQLKNSMGGYGWDTLTGCREHPCRSLRYYWESVPMSTSAGDGPDGVISLFPFLFEIFLKERWPLDGLLAVQKKRIAEVLQDIRNGKVTVSSGHYHSTKELMAEMLEHIAALQKLAVHSQTQVAPT